MNEFSTRLQDFVVLVSALYTNTVLSPKNLNAEKKRIKENLHTRAVWEYEKVDLKKHFENYKNFVKEFKKLKGDRKNIFSDFEPLVIESSLNLVKSKLDILDEVNKGKFKSNDVVRKNIFAIPTNKKLLDKEWKKTLANKKLLEVSGKMMVKDKTPEETKKMMEEMLAEARSRIGELVFVGKSIKKDLFDSAKVVVEIVDDPAFMFKCITDPKTFEVKVLISSHTDYSSTLIRFGLLHEFGHAIDSILFDKLLIPKNLASKIYSYAGVSTPNIYDIKAEVFADLVSASLLPKKEGKLMFDFRVNVWLLARSRADYAYHFEKKTFAQCMTIFQEVGLGEYAFEELMSISLFVSGQRGVFFYAHKYFEKIFAKSKLTHKQLLSLMLYAGKIPFFKYSAVAKKFLASKFEI